MANSLVHEDNTLNTSDHLPISVELYIEVARFECMTRTMFNWARLYQDKYNATMNNLLEPLLSQSVKVGSHYSVWANVCQRFESYQNETKRR